MAASVPAAAQARLEAAGLVVSPDAPAHVTAVTSGGAGPDVQRAALGLPADWDATAGDGVGVALVDTGVADSAQLAGRLFRGPDFSGEGDGVDHYGHGTFMAGLIAGHDTGVAPGATVVSIKVAGADGSTSLSKVIASIGWAVVHEDDMQLGVLSLSLGVDVPLPYQKDPLSGAVEAAWLSGLTVVVAAGNEGPGTVTSPGRDPFVVTVGATDNHGTASVADDTVAPWSGSQSADKKKDAAKPEVVAPGTSVVSLRAPGSTIDRENPSARIGDDQFRGSGTSMSTALTAGTAAVLLERHPEASPDEVKGAMVDGARTMTGGASALDLAGADHATADPNWVQDWKTFDGLPNGHAPWPGGVWVGSRWTSTRWSSTRWSSTRWSSTRWSSTRWSSTRWSSTRWSGSRWTSTRWSDAEWASTRWSSTRWSEEAWASTRWSSTRWSDAFWS